MRSIDETGRKLEPRGTRRLWPLVADIARAVAAMAIALAAITRLLQ